MCPERAHRRWLLPSLDFEGYQSVGLHTFLQAWMPRWGTLLQQHQWRLWWSRILVLMLLGRLRGVFGASLGPRGCVWGPLQAAWGASWGHLRVPWSYLGASLGHLGASLWPCWSLLLPSWGILGHLEPTGGSCGCHFETFWFDFASISVPFWHHFWHIPKSTQTNQN